MRGEFPEVKTGVVFRHGVWIHFEKVDNEFAVNIPQLKSCRISLLLNKLLDGFDGKLTSSKWAKIAKCSPDTALRDMQDLIQKKMLHKEEAGGRSTGYLLTN